MTAGGVDRTRVRVSEHQGYVVVMVAGGDGAQATVTRNDGHWVVTFLGVGSRYAACSCDDREPCQWPTADCYRGVGHLSQQCHGWHLPRAVVAAAALLIAHTDRTTAKPPPEGRLRRKNVVMDVSARHPRQRFNPRGGDA